MLIIALHAAAKCSTASIPVLLQTCRALTGKIFTFGPLSCDFNSMAGLFRLTALVLVPILSALYAYRGSLLSISVATVECTALKILLGSKVSFPTSNVYTASLDEYFSAQEKALVPSCIIRPQDSKDVATAIHALSLANKFGIGGVRFAIRGQGHTPWAGAANINGGITIDMRATKSISVNQGQTVTSVGSGAQWLDVYMTLDALGLSVSGGRVADVGVGGLTTGGMLKFSVEDNRFNPVNILWLFPYMYILSYLPRSVSPYAVYLTW